VRSKKIKHRRYRGRPHGITSPVNCSTKLCSWVVLLCVYALPLPSSAQQLVRAPRSDGATVPLVVYPPAAASKSCAPLAVISPGAGGTENGYSYLAEALQNNGYLTVVMGHKESGPAELRHEILTHGLHNGLLVMVTDPTLQHDRMLDLDSAWKWAQSQCSAPFTVLLGHSMGSDTVMFEAGAANKLGVSGHDRFDAYVALSPSGAGSIFASDSWRNIRKPLYVLTGTRDTGLEGDWQWRTSPFDDLLPGCKWLGVIDGATHMNFAGHGFSRKSEPLITDSIAAFLNGVRAKKCDIWKPPKGMRLTVN
jgi:predicted dienelactone hydrolase